MATEEPEAGEKRTFSVGPSSEPYLKFRFSQMVFYWFRLSPIARLLQYIPGSTALTLWAFKVAVLSRDFEEIHPSTDDGSNDC